MGDFLIHTDTGQELVLEHHGILGQKWGVRNGPPYPLSEEKHNASERKAGYKKSLSGNAESSAKTRKQNKSSSIRANKEKTVNRDRVHGPAGGTNTSVSDAYYRQEPSKAQLAQQEKNRKKVAAAVAAIAGVAGATAAAYMIIRYRQANAVAFATQKDEPTVDTMMKAGLTYDDAQNILHYRAKNGNKTLNSEELKELCEKVRNNGSDVIFEAGANFARVDFRKDYDPKMAERVLYVATNEDDTERYFNLLPNRHSNDDNAKPLVHALKATSEIRVPNIDKANDLLKAVADEKENYSYIEQALVGMYKNNYKRNYPGARMPSNSVFEEAAKKEIGRDQVNALITALGGHNAKLTDAVVTKFAEAGYNAMWDMHDVKDNVSDAPLIIFDAPVKKNGTRDDVEEYRRAALYGFYDRPKGYMKK